jgi:hypothetical protein
LFFARSNPISACGRVQPDGRRARPSSVYAVIREGHRLFDRPADSSAKGFLTERTQFRCEILSSLTGGGGSSRTGHNGALPQESEASDSQFCDVPGLDPSNKSSVVSSVSAHMLLVRDYGAAVWASPRRFVRSNRNEQAMIASPMDWIESA